MGVPQEDKREKEEQNILEKIVAKNFTNLILKIYLHIQEYRWTTSRINTKKSMTGHIIVKQLKTKYKEENITVTLCVLKSLKYYLSLTEKFGDLWL